jgi:hypothetical protein
MAGLVPAISIPKARPCSKNRDGRDKPGHDVDRKRQDRLSTIHSAAARPFCALRVKQPMAKSVDMMSPKVR